MDKTNGSLVSYASEEDEEREKKVKERLGECYNCRYHLECHAMCMKTDQTLKYPIHDCPGYDFKYRL